MSDSAFRRLLLDTVATVVAQPPSSLVELLRIATPGLLALSSSGDANERQRRAEAEVRVESKRDKLLRTLQLRIHPDKHPGDGRATELFQDVTSFYGRCVEAMEREDEARRRSDAGGTAKDVARSETNDAAADSQHVRWRDEDRRACPFPRGPVAGAGAPTHSDYESYGRQPDVPGRGVRKNADARRVAGRRRPPNRACPSAASLLLCPPVGACSMYHSFRVDRAWEDGRFGDARDHSDRALSLALLGYLCFGCLASFLLFGGDDGPESGWEGIRHNWPWHDGP